MKKSIFILPLLLFAFYACKKDDTTTPNANGTTASAPSLIFKFKFDSTQTRLDNKGAVAVMPAGHSGQCPLFNKISTHYIELAPNAMTPVGSGTKLYKAPETTVGGSNAINFDSSVVVAEGQECFRIALSKVTPGTYTYLRASLAYQNYNVKGLVSGFPITGTVASFIGFNTYVKSYKIKDSLLTINANKLQGYWGFETSVLGNKYVSTGQPPPGAVTVPNPIWNTSPIPAGSCLVTGPFTNPLTITGTETHDIIITMSLSTNKSFEWKDANSNGIYEPAAGDTVVDMGIRGLVPIVQ